jgi:ectoine hydroxylase-related dioxygenase (phytanoyl-CoA dioxygenase family)
MDYEVHAQAYHQHGFEIVRGFFSAEDLQVVEAQVQRYLREVVSAPDPGEVQYENLPSRPIRCVFRMHERSDYFRKLMTEPRLTRLVQALFSGADVTADGVMLIDKVPYASYEFPLHQDNAYQFWSPPEAVAATLALDESTSENGAIVCLRGSHTIGVLPHSPSRVAGASLSLVKAPDTSNYPEVALCLKPGDLALHHVNVIHRTGPNRTSRHRRNLGFSFHSSRARRDKGANACYQAHLRRINVNCR